MYEHLRNAFMSELAVQFDASTLNRILYSLDKVAKDYTISEKETALTIVDDEITRMVRLYLASKKLEGASYNTIDNYGNILRVFFDEVRKPPQELSTNEIRYFLAQYQMRRGISDRSLDKYREVLNTFFDWCANEEYTDKNPCKKINKIKYEIEPRRSLTRFQLERLRRNCQTPRELAIVDVLFSTACRATELVNMKFTDFDTANNAIKIIGKGGKHNVVYLNTNAQLSLNEYLKTRKGDSEYIFCSDRKPYGKLSTRSIEVIFDKISVDLCFKVTPHIIRHTSATLALQNGMEITQVQKMLGHSNVNTTMIYAETSQEDVATSHKRFVI